MDLKNTVFRTPYFTDGFLKSSFVFVLNTCINIFTMSVMFYDLYKELAITVLREAIV